MTKSTITREQRINEVKELIANAEEWAGYYEHPIHDKPQREMFEGMARVMAEHLAALIAMDSEPVAEVHQAPNVGICAALGPSIRMLCPLEPGTKLYRHAQLATASEPLAVTDVELNAALQLHRLKVDGHSQLSDADRKSVV